MVHSFPPSLIIWYLGLRQCPSEEKLAFKFKSNNEPLMQAVTMRSFRYKQSILPYPLPSRYFGSRRYHSRGDPALKRSNNNRIGLIDRVEEAATAVPGTSAKKDRRESASCLFLSCPPVFPLLITHVRPSALNL